MKPKRRPHKLTTALSDETDKRLRWLCYENRMTPAQVLELVITDAAKRGGYGKPAQAAQPTATQPETP